MTTPVLRWSATFSVFILICAALTGCESGVSEPQALTGEAAAALNILPGDARVVGMIDFKSMSKNEFTSPFADGPLSISHLGDEPAARVQDFLSATGLDLEKDLDRAYFAASGGDDDNAIVVAYGNYDAEKLLSFLRHNSPVVLDETTYRGQLMFTAEEDGRAASVAIASGSMVLAGGHDAVRGAIDRMIDGSASLTDNAQMMSLVRRVSHNASWAASASFDRHPEVSGTHSGPVNDEDLSAAIASAAVGLSVTTAGVHASAHLEPREGVRSVDLENLVKGAVSAMKVAPGKDDPEMLRVLDDVAITRSGNIVQVDVDVDNSVLEQIGADL